MSIKKRTEKEKREILERVEKLLDIDCDFEISMVRGKCKITLEFENDQPDEGSTLLSKVLSLVTKTHGEMQGKIRNACRKWDKDDVDRALDYLVKNGKLRVETTVRNANKYYLS